MNRRVFLKLGATVAVLPLVPKIPAPSFREGSDGTPVILEEAQWTPGWTPVGFATAINGYEHVYPTLARAVEGWKNHGRPMATNTVAYWNSGKPGRLSYNYQNITRVPYGVSDFSPESLALLRKLRQERLHQHLQHVEDTLNHGFRTYDRGRALRTCGGIAELGDGELCLYPLRDLHLWRWEGPTPHEDWLSEFTLRVY